MHGRVNAPTTPSRNWRADILSRLTPLQAIALAMLLLAGCARSRNSAPPSPAGAGGPGISELAANAARCGADPENSPLHRHVARPDSAFRWQAVREEASSEGVLIRLQLRSQVWQGLPWEHSLLLFLPAEAADGELLLMVLRQGEPAGTDAEALRTISRSTGTAAAFLFEMPNQPFFGGLEEDPLLAFSFGQYLRTGDDSWPLLFPMVASVMRAMDAVEAVTRASGDGEPLRRYVVAGHSKRGHAAWLAGVADPRVAGIIPIAIDVLNSRAQIAHHREVAGDISAPSQIFAEVIEAGDTPRGRCLMSMIDPYSYLAALAEPKLVVLGTNDDYTPSDALNLYWEGLHGPRSVLYLPNTSHAAANTHAAVNPTAFAFVRAVAAGRPLQEIDWSVERDDGVLRVRAETGGAVRSARLWISRSVGRDFRSSSWTDVAMVALDGGSAGPGAFIADATLPTDGYLALFIELEFEGDGEPFRLSTPMRIVDSSG